MALWTMNIIKTLRIDRSADFRLHQLDLQAAMSLVVSKVAVGLSVKIYVASTKLFSFLSVRR